MKKKLFTTVILLLWSVTTALAFDDVPEINRYHDAIEYLTVSGIINGYPDGTFKPDANINRAEFLKIALGSSNIENDIQAPSEFPDVDEDAWYGPYVRKAKHEGWIDGYPDGTFKPEQFVNKAEALKIVANIQQWKTQAPTTNPYKDTPAKAWYSAFVSYAKEKNFLEEQGEYFIPDALYSRAKMSEMLFRSYITNLSDQDFYSTNLLEKFPAQRSIASPEKSTTPSSSTPSSPTNGSPTTTPPSPDIGCPEIEGNIDDVTFSMIDTDFFKNITLEEPFPNIFYQNEVYVFHGTFNQNGTQPTLAFVFTVQPNGKCERFPVSLEKNSNNFSIPVTFSSAGNYKLGLILGASGESKVTNISVLDSIPQAKTGAGKAAAPSNPAIAYQKMKTAISWDSNENELIEVSLSQGEKAKTFLTRQGEDILNIDYTDFSNFKNGTVTISIRGMYLSSTFPATSTSNWSDAATKDFVAVTHQFSEVKDETLSLATPLPEQMSNIQKITISGTTNVDIFKEAAVIKPDGFVETFNMKSSHQEDYFGNPTIPEGESFTFEYNPAVKGTYILEINGIDGLAVLNIPVYIGNGTPLTPNFFDLNRFNQYEDNFNSESARISMLDLINSERLLHGLNTIVLDDSLNNLAQLHGEDMIERDFFGHLNPDGESPEDRRKKLNIPSTVGENLALAPTILYTHNGLMQSAVHRKNILNPSWTKVGISIIQNSNGTLVTVEEFSGEPLTEKNLQEIGENILTEINKKRSSAGVAAINADGNLQTAAQAWSDKMGDQNFFDFVSPNGETLSGIVNWYAPEKAVQALILESGSEEKLIDKILESPEVISGQWNALGLGLALDSIGVIKTTLLFAST